jgi:hypothetical protein
MENMLHHRGLRHETQAIARIIIFSPKLDASIPSAYTQISTGKNKVFPVKAVLRRRVIAQLFMPVAYWRQEPTRQPA